MQTTDLTPSFGTEVTGLELTVPLPDATCRELQELFDERGLLVFRGVELTHLDQIWLSKMLIGRQDEPELPGSSQLEDNFYISNRREESAAPFGRLQFHADTMWADQPFEVLSLFGVDVEQPSIPTIFVSAIHACATLPAALRARVESSTSSNLKSSGI